MPNARILIVEDEQIIALDLQRNLERSGYVVIGCLDRGELAVQRAQELRPDLVLMDIGLKGGMDGIEAARQVREKCGLPVIFLTAFADQATVECARLAEPDGFILKPFEEHDLSIAIEMAIDKHATEKSLRESEYKFRGVIENLADGISLADAHGNLVEWNPAAEKISGLKRSDVIGQPYWSVIFNMLPQPLRTEAIYELMAKQGKAATEKNYADGIESVEAEIEPAPGERRVIQTNGFVINASQGILAGTIMRDITARKQADEALRESEERLRVITANAPSIIVETDREGRVLFMSRVLPGYRMEAVLGKNVLDWLAPEFRPVLRQAFERVLSEGTPQSCETYGAGLAGEMRWYLTSLAPVTVASQIISMILVTTDITERKQVEQTLRDSEALYRQAIEVAGAVPYLQSYPEDDSNRVDYDFIGEGIREITGYGPEEFNEALWDGLTQERFLLEELAQYEFHDAIQQVRSGKHAIWKCEHRIRARDGQIHWVFEAAVELRDKNGISHGSIGMFQDITKRKQAEADLRKLWQAVGQSANVIVITDVDGRIEYANPNFTAVTGYTLKEALGQTPRILRSGAHPPEFYADLWRTIKSGKAWQGEFHNQRKDGSLYWEEATITPVFDPSGQIINFIAVKEDISARKALAAAEREQRQLAEALLDTATALNSTLKLDEVLDRVLENVGKLATFDGAMVLLVEGHTVRKIRYHSSLAQTTANQPPLGDTQANLLNLPILEEMQRTLQPCLIPETQADPRWHAMPGLGWVASFISAPVAIRGQIVGLINIISAEPGYFTHLHAVRLMAFANQVAIAIENARLFEQTHLLSITDPLTELHNRRYFFEVANLEFERRRRYGGALSAMLLDIDHFKTLNDTYGHAVGDLVLHALAGRIKSGIRTVDLLARYGGEEFVVLLPETSLAEACRVAERLRHSISEFPFEQDQRQISVSLSLGVAEMQPSFKNLDDLIIAADRALYAAKAAGRNRVACL